MCESVCKRESACGECILQDAQNMTEVVWQLGHLRFCMQHDKVLKKLYFDLLTLTPGVCGCVCVGGGGGGA